MQTGIKLENAFYLLKDAMVELELLQEKRQRLKSIEYNLMKRHYELEKSMNANFNNNDFIIFNIENLSISLANLQMAVSEINNEDLKAQYYATIRKLISLLNKKTKPEDFAFNLLNSNILQKSGLKLEVTGYNTLLLLSKGYTLIDKDTDARVKLKGVDVFFHYPSVGIGNKKAKISSNLYSLNEIMAKEYSVDIQSVDRLNMNEDFYQFFWDMKQNKTIELFEDNNKIEFQNENGCLFYKVDNDSFNFFEKSPMEILELIASNSY